MKISLELTKAQVTYIVKALYDVDLFSEQPEVLRTIGYRNKTELTNALLNDEVMMANLQKRLIKVLPSLIFNGIEQQVVADVRSPVFDKILRTFDKNEAF